MSQDILVWRARENDIFSREDAKKCGDKDAAIGNGYRKTGAGAFKNNIKIHQVKLDENVKEIGEESFSGCTSLRQINLGAAACVRREAFYNCTRLLAADLSSADYVGARSFALCKRLGEVKFAPKTKCRSIKRETFADCASLLAVKLSEGIVSIEAKAFYRCASLKEIQFPKSLRQIGAEAFLKCKELEEVTVPEHVREIGDRAFYGCGRLKILEIRGDLEKIGDAIVNKKTIIRCKEGSEAEKYCREKELKFEFL